MSDTTIIPHEPGGGNLLNSSSTTPIVNIPPAPISPDILDDIAQNIPGALVSGGIGAVDGGLVGGIVGFLSGLDPAPSLQLDLQAWGKWLQMKVVVLMELVPKEVVLLAIPEPSILSSSI